MELYRSNNVQLQHFMPDLSGLLSLGCDGVLSQYDSFDENVFSVMRAGVPVLSLAMRLTTVLRYDPAKRV